MQVCDCYKNAYADTFWYDRQCRVTDGKVTVKLYTDHQTFLSSVILPTQYYPVPGRPDDIRVFSFRNTVEISDEQILRLLDSVPYKIGHCYTNTAVVLQVLSKAGYNIKPYAGWLFCNGNSLPVHHCWAVLNGNSVIDLGDDFTALEVCRSAQDGVDTVSDTRNYIVDFMAQFRSAKNRVRCYPMGCPTPYLLYVGGECDPEDARADYRRLLKRYPHHECEANCDRDGINATQKMLIERGLMVKE